MFPDYNVAFERTVNSLSALDVRCRSLIEQIRTAKLAIRPPDKFPFEKEALEAEHQVIDMRTRELQVDVEQIVGKATSAIASLLTDSRTKYDKEVSEAKRLRRNRFSTIIVLGGAIPLVVYLAYIYFQGPVATTLAVTIVLGVASNLIGDGIGYLIASLKDKYPENLRKIHERHIEQIDKDVRSTTDGILNSHQFKATDEAGLTSQLFQTYQSIVDRDHSTWRDGIDGELKIIRQQVALYQAIRRDTISVIHNLGNSCSKFFDDSAHNIEVLNSVAGRIKQNAIEPSSELLVRTRQQLSNVKDDIAAIEFS